MASQQTISSRSIYSSELASKEFNPLHRNEPVTQAALTACAIRFLEKGTETAYGWREFSEWIGGYEYIYPDQRTILDELAILLIQTKGYEEFRKISYFLLTNCSLQTQQDLIEYMKGNLNGYPTKATLL